eukprot:Phypoly_transcript_18451.p1 GENE.Phypoly_transcript_18451~~Phypoly_transcript_18451.p1  ORF type:complete len:251 (+),score=21.81 Phypoly_transcript_18451:48-755(+)
MGGGGSHHAYKKRSKTRYSRPKTVAQEISPTRKRLEEQAAQFQAQKQADTLDTFLRGLWCLFLTDTIPRSEAGEKHFIFTGPVSAGKSSLLNKLLGLHLPVGYGHATTAATPVVKDRVNKVVIWDCPDYRYLNVNQLGFFKSADIVFLLCDSGLESAEQIVRAIVQITGADRCVILMTKCDAIMVRRCRTVDQEVEATRKTLAGWGIQDIRVMPTSAHGGFENPGVLRLMYTNNT